MKLKMNIFYLPVRTTTLEFLYSIEADSGIVSVWEIGKISYQMTLVAANYDDVKKRIGASRYAEMLGVTVDDLKADVELVEMKMVPA